METRLLPERCDQLDAAADVFVVVGQSERHAHGADRGAEAVGEAASGEAGARVARQAAVRAGSRASAASAQPGLQKQPPRTAMPARVAVTSTTE